MLLISNSRRHHVINNTYTTLIYILFFLESSQKNVSSIHDIDRIFLSLKEFVPYWLFRITSLIEIASIYFLQSALKRVVASPEATSWLLGPTTAAQVTIDDPYLPLFAIYDRSLSLTPFERRISPGCCISFRYCALEKVFTAPTYGPSFVENFHLYISIIYVIIKIT